MVELVVVIILIGIIGGIAADRFFERSTFDTVAWTERVRATLRYAQKRAIAQNSSVYVHLTQERVSVCLDENPACEGEGMRVPAPGGSNSGSGPTRAACGSDSWLCEAAPSGVSMRLPDVPAPPAGGVRFDGLGRATMLGNFSGRLQVSGDGITQSVGVDAESGYVD
ncbi:MSHA biogenesis protein MshC [Massilia sp. Mn16-1_5]|nr:MSHA biogenesis protein MshC [Massilia sp. Mn16-1_5]